MTTTPITTSAARAAGQTHRPVTMSLSVREAGDQSGRWLYSGSHTVEGAVRSAVRRCLDAGYALADSMITVYEGDHPTPVGALRLAHYAVATDRGQIVTITRL